MWMLILIGLNIISKLHGYSHGKVPESCESMLPDHRRRGNPTLPQTSDPPFWVTYEHGSSNKYPVKVTLKSIGSTQFRGFMLEAREASLNGEGPAVGKFTLDDPSISQLLRCNELEGSAVSHTSNHEKTTVTVFWTPVGEEQDIILRATFLETFRTFWEPVTINVTSLPSTSQPTTSASTSEPTTLQSTSQPATSASTSEPTTVVTTTIPPNCNCSWNLEIATVNLVFKEFEGTVHNILTVTFAKISLRHDLNKVVGAVCSLLCIVPDILILICLCIVEPTKVTAIALVTAVTAINLIELVIVLLPIELSHELRRIRDYAVEVCFILNHIFVVTFIFVGIDDSEDWNTIMPCIMAFTVWIFLSRIWSLVLTIQKRKILKCPDTVTVMVRVILIIFLVGTIYFAILITLVDVFCVRA
ncbi:ferric-chelate reductase 1-like [Cololabis saira]|uniref:ferric-chelate reductase 1-like n=1 Tax=Cololabis saira TaxID=129043 RepID=UPI002AD58D7B|nr:ferric-chelate reductase 1-like [Cololabis saira]